MKRGPIAWFGENTVAANLLMFLIVVGGLLTVPRILMEVFPQFSVDVITVGVAYLGASPEETEEGVCVRIEEEVQGIDGIKRVHSTAVEGAGSVTLELQGGADAQEVLDEVKARVDAITTFPDETEKPVVQEILIRRQVINVAVWGDAEEAALKQIAEQVRDEILTLPGITQAQLGAARPYEISIEVSEESLRRHRISFDDVARAVRRSSLDMPGGSVKTDGGEILLRTKGQAYRGREFEDLVLLTRPDGTRLHLGEVADVVDGFEDTDQAARFDGKPAVLVQVFRTGDESALDVARQVKEYVRKAQNRMPAGVRLTTWQDMAEILESRLNLLLKNGLVGLALVFGVLTLFLRLRLAFWVSLGIPISFLGALAMMPGLDVSLNMISMFAFILVLGIVVDDAIVVGESVYTRQRKGVEGVVASVEGAREVITPVVFAVLTSVAAFVPMLLIPGVMGKVFRVIPLIVIPTLLFSLVESMFILPAHLSHFRKPKEGHRPFVVVRAWSAFQGLFARGLETFIQSVYRPILSICVRWRYLTVAWGIGTLMITIGIVRGGYIGYTFFPKVEADNVVALLTMPQGTRAEVTAVAIRRLEETAEQVRVEMDAKVGEPGKSVYRHVLTSIGEQPFRAVQHRGPAGSMPIFVGSELGEVNIELAPSEERDISSMEISRRWRELTGSIPDAVELMFSTSLFSSGEAINVQLMGSDIDVLRQAAAEVKVRLAEYPGVFDVTDSFREGKQEVKLDIRPSGEALGLSRSDLARQVRQGFYGEEAQRIQRGRDDVKVMVRYPSAKRRSLGDLESMRIRTPAGVEVPFATVAMSEPGRGYAAIRRADRKRAINVTCDVDSTKGNANLIQADLAQTGLPEILGRYPGIAYTFEGEGRERRETMEGIFRSYALIVLPMIFALMAIPFRSYVQPLLVMTAIPFGLVGAVWGHVIMGLDLTILSMFGLVALSGVVVNDSLVLVDRINRKRRDGVPLEEAVRTGAMIRFRPILLTSLTTFAAITPLLLEKSVQARFLVPMGVSLSFGVLFSTFITLVLIPCGYTILEDLRKLGTVTFL